MFGFMFVTWVLSMCIANTSTTALMIPIVISVLDQLHESENKEIGLDKLEIEEGLEVGLEQTNLGYDSARTVAINPKSFDSEIRMSDDITDFGGSMDLEASTQVLDSQGEDLQIVR